jgi:Flp pilus assembly protein CpaB
MSAVTAAGPGRQTGRPGLPTRQRRPLLAGFSVAVIILGAAIGGILWQRAGAKVAVVVMAADVPAGHVITRSDVSTLSVAGGIHAIRGEYIDRVVGQRAGVALLRWTPLQRSMLSSTGALGPGQAQVGMALRSGQIPADGVRPGDLVDVLSLPPPDAAGGGSGRQGGPQLLAAAVPVWSTRPDPAQSGGTLVTVIVPQQAASLVASASNSGDAGIVKVSGAQ